MKVRNYGSLHSGTSRVNLAVLLAVLYSLHLLTGCNVKSPSSIMPGTRIWDVTDPGSWGGDPALASTPDNPSDDDAPGINAAMEAAMQFLRSRMDSNELHAVQQLIYLPPGIYHLESPVIVPKYRNTEAAVWIYGEGEEKTILRLKPAKEIGTLGSPEDPVPLVRFALYTYGREGSGNINFHLWATNFSIEVPSDQPYVVGMSYGAANMGGVRNITIRAEGNAGRTGFAMLQYNNGPGWVEHLTVEGFHTGVEINDGWGEIFGLRDINLINQNPGGKGISITDKQIAIEGMKSRQDQADVVPVYLHEDDAYNSEHGGAPQLILLDAVMECNSSARVPAILIERGHSYLRNITTTGYGTDIITDHGTSRTFDGGRIPGEYISVHGKTPDEKDNVAYTINAPATSLNFDAPPAPELDPGVFEYFMEGRFTIASQADLKGGELLVTTPWVILDHAGATDHTALLQAALNCGAPYIGIMNGEPLIISETVTINGADSRKVELIFGYMSEIYVTGAISQRLSPSTPGEGVLFRIETGEAEKLHIKGLRITAEARQTSDFLLFFNNSSRTVVFEDFRCKDASRHYRNGPESKGSKVFFENVEFAYNGIFNDVLMLFDNQHAWARQFNVEAPIRSYSMEYKGKEYSSYTTMPKVLNHGGELWVLLQKLGEHNGVFVQTEAGGRTEMLSVYYNQARTGFLSTTPEATNFLVKDAGSEFSMVGQERIRTTWDEQGVATRALPHGNRFGVMELDGVRTVIEGTSLPTYLQYEGVDPFMDSDYTLYEKQNHFRVGGLVRVALEK